MCQQNVIDDYVRLCAHCLRLGWSRLAPALLSSITIFDVVNRTSLIKTNGVSNLHRKGRRCSRPEDDGTIIGLCVRSTTFIESDACFFIPFSRLFPLGVLGRQQSAVNSRLNQKLRRDDARLDLFNGKSVNVFSVSNN